MIGIILATTGSLAEEISSSIGKFFVAKKTLSRLEMGFLQLFSVGILLTLITLIKPASFIFNDASWPYVIIRFGFEILQAELALVAVNKADRSTFSFFRMITVPCLFLVDLALGYYFTDRRILGICILFLILSVAALTNTLGKAGRLVTILSAFTAVVTISLYKFNISHFNSVVAEQAVIVWGLMIYFFLRNYFESRSNPLRLLKTPKFVTQSVLQGVATLVESFAYSFAPASIILAAKRTSALMFATISGNRIFKEANFLKKITLAVLITLGLILLV